MKIVNNQYWFVNISNETLEFYILAQGGVSRGGTWPHLALEFVDLWIENQS